MIFRARRAEPHIVVRQRDADEYKATLAEAERAHRDGRIADRDRLLRHVEQISRRFEVVPAPRTRRRMFGWLRRLL